MTNLNNKQKIGILNAQIEALEDSIKNTEFIITSLKAQKVILEIKETKSK